jgi:hypothetical protein
MLPTGPGHGLHIPIDVLVLDLAALLNGEVLFEGEKKAPLLLFVQRRSHSGNSNVQHGPDEPPRYL